MQLLEAWILSVLLGLLPPAVVDPHWSETQEEIQQRYASISHDMAEVVSTEEPLFRGPQGRWKTAALLVSVMRYESSFRPDVDSGETRGDHGRSWCLMQINIGKKTVRVGPPEMRTWTGQDLIQDRRKCIRAGLEHLRASMAQCRQHRTGGILISGYIHGPRCLADDERSNLRWSTAAHILKTYPIPPNEPPLEVAYGG